MVLSLIKKQIVALFLTVLFCQEASSKQVSIQTVGDCEYQLIRDGKPYLVKGANWPTPATIEDLVSAGGNSVRTYSGEIEWMLPLARKHDLSIMLGLHLERERLGFDYTDSVAVEAQRTRILKKVRRLKNEPEILFWAIGNEPELAAKNTVALWKEVNHLARLIRAEDPDHPIVTVVAGFDQKKIKELVSLCPELDALGINWYGPATDWPTRLVEWGWTKPYLHTEFGSMGYWQGSGSQNTSWGAPVEQTSTEKAALYAANWQDAVLNQPGRSLGGYAFIWNWKQERTHTWFSMHLPTGERTGAVDAMQTQWTGHPPENPAPKILEWKSLHAEDVHLPGKTVKIKLRWTSPRPAVLTVETRTESSAVTLGGDPEPPTHILPNTSWQVTEDGISVQVPQEPGAYRIFAQITTKDQTVAIANLPILVRN